MATDEEKVVTEDPVDLPAQRRTQAAPPSQPLTQERIDASMEERERILAGRHRRPVRTLDEIAEARAKPIAEGAEMPQAEKAAIPPAPAAKPAANSLTIPIDSTSPVK